MIGTKKEKILKQFLAVAVSFVFVLSTVCISDTTAYAREDRSGNFAGGYSLNGTPQQNIISVARAQLGRTKYNFGYNEAWCADFISDCAIKAGLSNIIPPDGYCPTFYNAIVARGGQAVSSPQAGDIVFYYCTRHKQPWVHVGLMINSTQSIEGNYGGKVTLVNGWYNDGQHNTGNYVQKRYLRPAYGNGSSSNIWDGFSTDYAGDYVVTTNSLPLTLRNAPSQSGSQLALVPRGTTVHVEKANGSWAYASYNGQYGYLSMSYLSRVQQQSLPGTQIHYWLSDTKMGNAISSAKNGDTVYFCYELKRQDNGNLVDVGSYSVKQTIYDPDGSEWDNTYDNSNNNWVSFTADKGGSYKCVLDLTGDWSGSYTLTLDNVPSLNSVSSSSWFSSSDMGSETHNLEKGKQYYFCFKVLTNEGKYFNDAVNMNSTLNINVKAPNGTSVINTSKYNTDRYSYRFTATQTGRYSSTYTFKAADFDQLNGDGYADCVDKTPKLTSIAVTKNPSKLTYTVGDKIDTTGLQITAKYSDGSSKTVSGYQVNCDLSGIGRKYATIKYTENNITKATGFYVTVKKKESEKIIVTYNPNGGTMSKTIQQADKDGYVNITAEKPVKFYTIKFDSAGGDQTPADVKVNCKFLYWTYAVGNGNQAILKTGTQSYYKPGKDCTVKANYEKAKISQSLPQVSREGYKFLGWYKSDGTQVAVGSEINDNITLMARWSKDTDSSNDTGSNGNDSDNNGSNDSDKFNVDTDDDDSDVDIDTIAIGDELETDDAVYTVTGIGDGKTVEYSECEDDAKKIVVPDTVTIEGNTYTVTSIGEKAFYKDTSLKAVSIGKNVKSIDNKAFYGCKNLKQIVVYSKNISKVQSGAFKKVPKSVNVYVPKTKYNAYKKIFKKGGISIKAKFKKIK